jgi:hypothetical protein
MPFVDRALPGDFKIEPIAPRKSNLPPGPGPGRPKGSVNKVVRDLKEGVLTAAENIGNEDFNGTGLIGYLEDLGRHHKRAFASLLVKVLPMSVTGDGTLGAQIGAINIVSIESGKFLSPDGVEQFERPGLTLGQVSQPAPLLLEQRPPEPAPMPAPSTSEQLAALEAHLATLPRAELLRLAGLARDDE